MTRLSKIRLTSGVAVLSIGVVTYFLLTRGLHLHSKTAFGGILCGNALLTIIAFEVLGKRKVSAVKWAQMAAVAKYFVLSLLLIALMGASFIVDGLLGARWPYASDVPLGFVAVFFIGLKVLGRKFRALKNEVRSSPPPA